MLNPRRTICLLVTLLILPAVGMAGQEPSLAELARKEKERRAQTQAKVRVLSNSDVAKFQKGTVTTGVYGEEPTPKTALSETPNPCNPIPLSIRHYPNNYQNYAMNIGVK